MANYAYRDVEHTDKVFAKDVLPREQEFIFYCANKECNCRFGIAAINSNKVRPYFSKLPSSSHIVNCWNDIEFSVSGDKGDYDLSDFSPDSLLAEIIRKRQTETGADTSIHKEGVIKKSKFGTDPKGEIQYIHTIRQLYTVCMSTPDNEEINGIAVKYLFAGRKTKFLYTKYITGIRLVECIYNSYAKLTNTIYFKFPYDTVGNGRFKVEVTIKDTKLFDQIRNDVNDSKSLIIIYADWKNNKGEIRSKKQIVVMKQR